ncbi:MAG: Uma2 family endonuclease [Chloroflexi bacterium]|nr:Uma2 family endonuclease [Chloroflexota bacterium]MCC6893429.1 Uma2 family endonuclease [Anaerolineae bacterium]
MDKIALTLDMPGQVRISGKIIATDVSYDAFMQGFDGQHVEWVNGVVIEMPSIDARHDALVHFFRLLFGAYFDYVVGRVLGDPMIMRLTDVRSSRAPDILVLLEDRLDQLHQNEVIGPANLVIEIVSEGNSRTDYVDKRREYELGGVPEYWIVNHKKKDAIFLQMNADGIYDEILPDERGFYRSKALPQFHFPVAVLWQEKLPGFSEIGRLVQVMFG